MIKDTVNIDLSLNEANIQALASYYFNVCGCRSIESAMERATKVAEERRASLEVANHRQGNENLNLSGLSRDFISTFTKGS